MTMFLLVVPIYGCFFPLESYLSLGQGEGLTGFANLPIPVTTLMLVAMTVAVAWYFVNASRYIRVRHEPIAYCLIAIALLSVAWSANPSTSFIRAIRLIPIVLLPILLVQIYSPARLTRMMTIAFLIAALLSIAVAVAIPALGSSRLGNGYESAWRGAMVHKNLTGIVFAIGVMVSWTAYSIRAARLPLAALSGSSCFVMVVASQSGTSLSGLLLAIPVALGMRMIQRSPAKLRVVMSVAFLFAVVAGAVAAVLVVNEIFAASGRDLTFTGRTPIWAAVWDLIKARPLLGYGYAFWVSGVLEAERVAQTVGAAVPHSHNSWLDIWLQLGIFAVLAAAWLTLAGFRLSLKLSLTTSNRFGPMLFAIQFLVLFRSMIEVQYTDPFPSLLFFLLWAVTTLRLVAKAETAPITPLNSRAAVPLMHRPALYS